MSFFPTEMRRELKVAFSSGAMQHDNVLVIVSSRSVVIRGPEGVHQGLSSAQRRWVGSVVRCHCFQISIQRARGTAAKTVYNQTHHTRKMSIQGRTNSVNGDVDIVNTLYCFQLLEKKAKGTTATTVYSQTHHTTEISIRRRTNCVDGDVETL